MIQQLHFLVYTQRKQRLDIKQMSVPHAQDMEAT